MAVTIKGIRIEKISIGLGSDEPGITSEYSLISSIDKVLAKQSVGNYGLKVPTSMETQKALDVLIACHKADVNSVLGLE